MKNLPAAIIFSLAVFLAAPSRGVENRFKELFGDNVYVFSPGDAPGDIDRTVAEIFERQHGSQFGGTRYALLFLPGDYTSLKTLNLGYYTQILGLGRLPYDVTLPNVKVPAALPNNNATCNFWIGIENLSIADTDNNEDSYFSFQWAASQAAPLRRLYVERKAVFDWFYGWASGGFVADSVFKKPVGSWSQQQYYYRNSDFGAGLYGVNWNQLVEGCRGANVKTDWADGGKNTVVPVTAAIREKPFLFFDAASQSFKVFAPSLRRDAAGTSWSRKNAGDGKTIDLKSGFYVAKADRDTAATLNAALSRGSNLLLTPGIYRLEEPLKVSRPDTIVLGIGMATLLADNSEAAIVCADEDGISVCGVLLDAGKSVKRLLLAGESGSSRSHSENPIMLQDVFCRVGGTGAPASVDVCIEINACDTIVDHTWIWRADHGANTGWTANTARNGLTVNGDRVVCHGLFVEHFQEYDVLWNGEDGKTLFLQNEKCYDPPGNDAWMSHGGKKKGYAAYKVADGVKKHFAAGLGVYDVFIYTGGRSVFLDDAIEVPDVPGVAIENACIVEIANGDGPLVGINHIVNGKGYGIKTGRGSGGGYAVQRLVRYSDGKADIRPDYYRKH